MTRHPPRQRHHERPRGSLTHISPLLQTPGSVKRRSQTSPLIDWQRPDASLVIFGAGYIRHNEAGGGRGGGGQEEPNTEEPTQNPRIAKCSYGNSSLDTWWCQRTLTAVMCGRAQEWGIDSFHNS